MSRPTTGSIKATAAGTFEASLPIATGERRRKTHTFHTKAAALKWIKQGVAALDAGRSLPAPDPSHLSRAPRRATSAAEVRTRFGVAGAAFIQEHYVEDQQGDVGREEQVRGYVAAIDTYLQTNGHCLETVTRQAARDMFRSMLRAESGSVSVRVPSHLDPNALVTKGEALELLAQNHLKISETTFKRGICDGELLPADKSGNSHRYTVSDIFTFAANRPGRRAGGKYSHSTLRAVRSTFRAVLAHAEANGVVLQPGVRDAKLPKNKSPKQRTRALTLAETERVAAHLHVVHQLALWLLRCLGLRLSEAFGLLVEDVIDAGPGQRGLVTVQSQGGRKFYRRQPDGTVAVLDHVDETKRDSYRILVVPAPLMDLIRLVVDVFHTNLNGTVDAKARLIPGLEKRNTGGQSAFRRALKQAGRREGLNLVADPRKRGSCGEGGHGRTIITPTPKSMRKAFSTALQADRQTIEDIRAALGHRRGTDVIHEHYLVEDSAMKPQRRIAKALTKQILAETSGSLMVPTAKSCTTGKQPALAVDAARLDSMLTDAGWLVTQARPAGNWVTVSVAAELRGVSPTQIRSDIEAGRVRSFSEGRPEQRGHRYLVAEEDVLALADRLAAGSGMRQLSEELGEPYDKIRQYIRRSNDLHCEPRGGRDYHLTDEVAEKVRVYFREQQELERRAVRLPEVARELAMSVAAIDTLIRQGRLDEDVRFHGGVRSITEESLLRLQRKNGRRRRA